MKINEVDYKNAYNIGFTSIRTDRLAVAQLAKGEKPIIENNKLNIIEALNNLGKQHTPENILFLLSVADNLAYGQGNNSEFKDNLDRDKITPSQRENTDWNKLLDDTIRTAISLSDEDVSEYIDEYQRIFTEKKKLTPEQKEVLDLRKKLTRTILSRKNVKDETSVAMAANTRQNLDYFVASSEIPIKQKKESLEKLAYFMSDAYKINPQLKGKKLQVLDEILNDIVVKTPNDEFLKTKAEDQRSSGMCAAISICRKAMAYEDKSKFIDLVMDELKDSNTMSVYDITELG